MGVSDAVHGRSVSSERKSIVRELSSIKVKRSSSHFVSSDLGNKRKRGCVNQVFTLKRIVGEYMERKKDLFAASMNLEEV